MGTDTPQPKDTQPHNPFGAILIEDT